MGARMSKRKNTRKARPRKSKRGLIVAFLAGAILL